MPAESPPSAPVERALELGIYSGALAHADLPDDVLEILVDNVEQAIAGARNTITDPDGGLVRAFACAQARFPTIPKTKTATVQMSEAKGGGKYTYSYADLADVLAAVRPVLAAESLAITQRTERLDRGGYLLVTDLLHTAGGKLSSEVELAQSPGAPQMFGGALTYLRRYELVTLLGIHADEDTDGQHVTPTNGHAAAAREPELPRWAVEARKERKVEFLDALEPIIGRAAAAGIGTAARDTIGHLPEVLVVFARAIREAYLDDPSNVAEIALLERRRDAIARRDAAAVIAEQDAAAEAPDPPAPDDETAGERLAATVAAAVAAGEEADGEEPPPDAGADPDDDTPPAGPAPGTLEAPDLPDNPAKAIGILRGAGCTCKDPLATLGERPDKDDACPIRGHGLPF